MSHPNNSQTDVGRGDGRLSQMQAGDVDPGSEIEEMSSSGISFIARGIRKVDVSSANGGLAGIVTAAMN